MSYDNRDHNRVNHLGDNRFDRQTSLSVGCCVISFKVSQKIDDNYVISLLPLSSMFTKEITTEMTMERKRASGSVAEIAV